MIAQLNTFPSLRGVVGKWVFYSTLMTADQIVQRISTAKNIREAKSLDDYLQRDLKNNVKKITKYLLNNEWRMFNSIIVGVFDGIPDWITFDLGRIEQLSAIDEADLNYLSSSVGLLILTGEEKMFAIDGQHRVEGIRLAFEQNKESLCKDQYPVILVAHNDDPNGKKMTRRLFADINKKAVRVSSGDLVIIDEEDICAVVARKIYSEYEYFEGGKIIALTSNANLEKDDVHHFTNLLTLNNIVKTLKPRSINSNCWNNENANELYLIVKEFIDFNITNIAEYSDYFVNKNKTIEYFRRQNINLLFRPIGLSLLARLYIHFNRIGELTYLKENINKLDFELPGKHFNLVMWNEGRFETKYQDVGFMLSLYLLNKLSDQSLEGDDGLNAKFRRATKGALPIPEKIV